VNLSILSRESGLFPSVAVIARRLLKTIVAISWRTSDEKNIRLVMKGEKRQNFKPIRRVFFPIDNQADGAEKWQTHH